MLQQLLCSLASLLHTHDPVLRMGACAAPDGTELCVSVALHGRAQEGKKGRAHLSVRDFFYAQALTGGDGETLAGTLRAARTGVVQGLAAVSTESAARVNPALLQLQLLDELAAAGEAALPAAGLIDLTGRAALLLSAQHACPHCCSFMPAPCTHALQT
jgi:hypothetical protein